MSKITPKMAFQPSGTINPQGKPIFKEFTFGFKVENAWVDIVDGIQNIHRKDVSFQNEHVTVKIELAEREDGKGLKNGDFQFNVWATNFGAYDNNSEIYEK